MKGVVIYRHPECKKCARMARRHHLFDWFNRVAVVTTTPPTGPLQMGEIIVEDLATGRFLAGAEGLNLICRQIARRAKEHLSQPGRRRRIDPAQVETLAQQFLSACRDGDVASLMTVLAEDSTLMSDGGVAYGLPCGRFRDQSALLDSCSGFRRMCRSTLSFDSNPDKLRHLNQP